MAIAGVRTDSAATSPPATTAAPAAQQLARWALALAPDALPDAVWEKAQLCLLDFLACALRAGDLPWSRQAVARTRALGAKPEATVIGTDLKTAASEAAFANGVMGHGLIREDMHPASSSHIGVVVLPAALALAERAGASGGDFACALAAGYEVMARVGKVLNNERYARYFRPTGTTGPLGAAAAGARVLRLDEAVATQALGFAGGFGSGLNEWGVAGGTDIYFHAGMGARSGVIGVELAQEGGHFCATILDGDCGLLNAHGAGADRADELFAGLSENFEILNVTHKPVPACSYVQTPCQTAERIVAQGGFAAVDIAAVRVHSFPAATTYPGCDSTGPFQSIQQSKMSIQFAVASVLAHGRIDDENFRRLDDPETLRIAQATTLIDDDGLAAAFPARQGAIIEVTLTDGRHLREEMATVAWVDGAGVRARFRADAERTLGAARAAEIEAMALSLKNVDDMRVLTRLLGT